MENIKKWYKSKSVIGGIVAILAFVVSITGIDLDEGTITELVTVIFEAVGLVVAVYGRIVAQYKVTT